MPPGAVPPFIIQYNASSVPIIQLALSGKTLSEAQLYDYGIYRIRQRIAPIQGSRCCCPTAASHGRSWSTSTRRRCWQSRSRVTSARPSTSRTRRCRPAP
jgi:hypothetical protein